MKPSSNCAWLVVLPGTLVSEVLYSIIIITFTGFVFLGIINVQKKNFELFVSAVGSRVN